ncbi:protein MEI2-like 5 [Malania oleifera]|uniref:protein MEI2-like 5 n=1 Tax=Malania oleifera TaxID=397392 RepID=UPI0025AECC5B|nr:protein MEI2-like 5 [Malania oleifera]
MEQYSEHLSSGASKITSANLPKEMGGGAQGSPEAYHASTDATLFSSSLPVLHHEKLNVNESESGCQSVDDSAPCLNKLHEDVKCNALLDDVETHAIGSLLPDDEDELLAGLTDDYDLTRLPNQDDLEECDFFGSVGGMELESDTQESLNIGMSKISFSDGGVGNGVAHYGLSNGVGTVAGEHPFGEHPSRTLFVRNINSNVEDSELRTIFEQYGDIRTLYTTCKHRGFVMISYYDIRSARTAMRTLQNKPLRRRKLDIHFSIPKDNPSDKDINQGTLVVFNLDPSVSNDDLRQIFGAYGEVKEIRETPHKRHHKFIEFYDVRAAEAALKALNRSDIAGKRIKLEPSRPGGARRNFMLQLNQDLDHNESRGFRHQAGSPITSSPPSNWVQFNSLIEHNPLQTISKPSGFGTMSPISGNHLSGLASILHSQVSKAAPISKDQGRGSHIEHLFTQTNAFQQPHSLPEPKFQFPGDSPSFGASASNGSSTESLSRSQFLWGSPNLYSKPFNSSAWRTPSVGHPYTSNGQRNGFSYSGGNGSLFSSSQHHHPHHVGSAPSGVPLERHIGFFQESHEPSLMSPVSFGNMNLSHNDGSFTMNLGAHIRNSGISTSGNMPEKGSPSVRMMSSPRLSPIFPCNSLYRGLAPLSVDGLADRGQSRQVENSANQIDSKKQFQLDLDKIVSGEDTRTTLMIKNIPNKYTSKMLLAAIDESNRGTYDFLYLPIDFKNKCNVGYAFINMLSPSHIVQFYQAFYGKKWEKFNSEKVASLAYARIQGKAALVNHFQNSSLMNEDKRCRPILFHSEGSEPGDQVILEHFPPSGLNIQVHQPNGMQLADSSESVTNGGPSEKADQS